MTGRRPGGLLFLAGLLALAGGASATAGARPGAALEDIALTPRERNDVLAGKIVVRELPAAGGTARTYEGVGLLAGRLDHAFAVITDFRRYAEFMPGVKRTLVREEAAGVSVVELELRLPLGQARRYRLRYEMREEESGFVVAWRKVPWPELRPDQTIADTGGRWLVRRLDDGNLLASYLFSTDPRPVPLGLTGIADAFGRRSLPDVIRSVGRRIRALFPGEGGERPGPQNSRP
ncbi:MAG TPA: SRPBCC family protein [Terriglobales bacterium]|nr:SRPBCC family protein [Terriglobales bacterium]